ncbi:alpha/beta fold hydrolase [Candidimonas nitroreducens]|uniref:alpha/beta hydrolase n=1 Tax=Candidimonas nitroreducens TaxID=683354 RepID=UPI001177EE35|nr:alpha/beta hydrolase [Candidimonas nitroreducens]
MKRLCCTVAAVLAAAQLHAAPLDHGALVVFPTRAGVTQGLYVQTPSASPPLVVVIYCGGGGILRLNSAGPTQLHGNFVIRTAHYWVDKGYAAVLVDAPSDRQYKPMDDYYRLGKDALADQRFVIEQVRKHFPRSKIVLLSTSRGTVTVGNVLQHAPELADLYVLTSPLSIAARGPGIANLAVPPAMQGRTLLVSNKHDACDVSRYDGGKRLAERNHLAFITEESSKGGGSPKADCGGHSPHGFLGVEDKTLNDINSWIRQKL